MPLVIDELFRFRMLMAGVYSGIAISSTYGFSLLTQHMKDKYSFNQSDITTISTVGNCCGYLVFFAGILFDYAGPKVLFPIAGMFGFLGFVLFGLAFDDKIPYSSKNVAMIQFCIFNAILYFGCPAMDAATLMPLMVNFPLERGYMVIIQKTFAGLGTSVLMVYFNGWFFNVQDKAASSYSGYAYFIGAQILFCSLLACYFIDFAPYYPCQWTKNRQTPAQAEERKAILTLYVTQHAPLRRLYIGCALVGATLIFLTVNSIIVAYVPTHKYGYVACSVVAVALLACFSIMALPIQALGRYPVIKRRHPDYPALGYTDEGVEDYADIDEIAARQAQLEDKRDPDSDNTPPQLPEPGTETVEASSPAQKPGHEHSYLAHVDQEGTATEDATATVATAPPPAPVSVTGDPQYRNNFWRNMLTIDLWLFWLSFFSMWGTGTVMNTNATQIYRSVNGGKYDQSVVTLYVALMGVGSALGRILGGVIDMWLTRRKVSGKKVPLTTTFLPLCSILLFVAYLMFALVPVGGLIIPFVIGSMGVGMGWGLGALCVRIVYAKDIGKTYNFMYSSGFVCTIALNRFMFGQMYDNEAKRLGTSPECNQASCVRKQMWILMASNGVSTITAILAHIRYSRYVKRERAKQALELAAPAEDATMAAIHSDGEEVKQ